MGKIWIASAKKCMGSKWLSSEIRGGMVLWTSTSVIHGYPLKSR